MYLNHKNGVLPHSICVEEHQTCMPLRCCRAAGSSPTRLRLSRPSGSAGEAPADCAASECRRPGRHACSAAPGSLRQLGLRHAVGDATWRCNMESCSPRRVGSGEHPQGGSHRSPSSWSGESEPSPAACTLHQYRSHPSHWAAPSCLQHTEHRNCSRVLQHWATSLTPCMPSWWPSEGLMCCLSDMIACPQPNAHSPTLTA